MSKTASADADEPDVEPRPVPDERSRTLEQVATRRLFDTSRELMVARDPEAPRGHRNGIAYTCDCCGRGGCGLKEKTTRVAPGGKCGCLQKWVECRNDDCEQQAWSFVDYEPCLYHGRMRADDIHRPLTSGKSGVFARE